MCSRARGQRAGHGPDDARRAGLPAAVAKESPRVVATGGTGVAPRDNEAGDGQKNIAPEKTLRAVARTGRGGLKNGVYTTKGLYEQA